MGPLLDVLSTNVRAIHGTDLRGSSFVGLVGGCGIAQSPVANERAQGTRSLNDPLPAAPVLTVVLTLMLALVLALALACMFALMLACMLGVVTPMGLTLITVPVVVSVIIIVSVISILAGIIPRPSIGAEHYALAVGMAILVMLLVVLSSGRRSCE